METIGFQKRKEVFRNSQRVMSEDCNSWTELLYISLNIFSEYCRCRISVNLKEDKLCLLVSL